MAKTVVLRLLYIIYIKLNLLDNRQTSSTPLQLFFFSCFSFKIELHKVMHSVSSLVNTEDTLMKLSPDKSDQGALYWRSVWAPHCGLSVDPYSMSREIMGSGRAEKHVVWVHTTFKISRIAQCVRSFNYFDLVTEQPEQQRSCCRRHFCF